MVRKMPTPPMLQSPLFWLGSDESRGADDDQPAAWAARRCEEGLAPNPRVHRLSGVWEIEKALSNKNTQSTVWVVSHGSFAADLISCAMTLDCRPVHTSLRRAPRRKLERRRTYSDACFSWTRLPRSRFRFFMDCVSALLAVRVIITS